jgi:hypothetical protein
MPERSDDDAEPDRLGLIPEHVEGPDRGGPGLHSVSDAFSARLACQAAMWSHQMDHRDMNPTQRMEFRHQSTVGIPRSTHTVANARCIRPSHTVERLTAGPGGTRSAE